MIKVITSLGEVLKSVLTIVASDAIKTVVVNPDVQQNVASTVGAAISAVHIPTVVQKAASSLTASSSASYSANELKIAEREWIVRSAESGDISLSDAFAAGAAFASTHACSSLSCGVPATVAQSVTNAIAAATGGRTGALLTDAVHVAVDVAEGNTAGAAVEIASDVVGAVEEATNTGGYPEAPQTTEHHPV